MEFLLKVTLNTKFSEMKDFMPWFKFLYVKQPSFPSCFAVRHSKCPIQYSEGQYGKKLFVAEIFNSFTPSNVKDFISAKTINDPWGAKDIDVQSDKLDALSCRNENLSVCVAAMETSIIHV